MTRLDAALSLAARGFPVLPVRAGSKAPPLIRDWPQLATTDKATVEKWWSQWPDANIAVHTKNLVVIDVDVVKGGLVAFDMLSDLKGLPETLTTLTPSGGRHHFYRLSEGHPGVPNGVDVLGPGLDVRSTNGFVIAPGSTVPAGEYKFQADVPVADAPAWLLAKLGEARTRATEPKAAVPNAPPGTFLRAVEWIEHHAPAREGAGGDLHTFKTAAALRDRGLSLAQAYDLMLGWNQRCSPPWQPEDLHRKVENAYTYSQEGQAGKLALTDDDFASPAVQERNDKAATLPPALAKTAPQKLSDFAKGVSGPYVVKGLLSAASYAVASGPSGEGKAQPLDEPVLTPSGWSTIGALRAGDFVIGSQGLPVRVRAVFPQGLREEWEVVFSNGQAVRCCDEHLWATYKGERKHVVTTRAMAAAPRRTWRVPLVAPVNYDPSPNPLPLDPYLVGALLGDGGITAYVGFSSADEELLDEIRSCIPAGHELHRKSGNNGHDYQIVAAPGQPNHVWTALRLLGLAGKKSCDKEVPAEYMTAPAAARLRLLQGLMDTDGYATSTAPAKGGRGRVAEFAVSSRKLAEQVRDLVGSLGGVAGQIRRKETTGLPSYRLSFRMGPSVSPFRLRRKADKMGDGVATTLRVDSVRPTGRAVEMQCIAVESPDHLYVTAGYVLTHNTFWALDVGYHVAAGKPWHGRRVKQGTVLYLPYEGVGGLRKRAEALRRQYGPAEVPFYVMPISVNLREPEGRRQLAESIALLPQVPSLIIVDTFAQALMGGDENSAQDVGAFNRAVAGLIEKTGACVLVIHHPPKNGEGLRGSGALKGAVDIEIEINQRRVRSVKQRDFDLGEPLFFSLKPIVVGVDEDGDEVTSCVFVQGGPPANTDRAASKLTGAPGHVFEKLCELRSTNAPITQAELREACADFLSPRRSALYDALTRLRRLKLVVIGSDGMVQRKLE